MQLTCLQTVMRAGASTWAVLGRQQLDSCSIALTQQAWLSAGVQVHLDHNRQLVDKLQQQLSDAVAQQQLLRTNFQQLEAVSETGRAAKAEARWEGDAASAWVVAGFCSG